MQTIRIFCGAGSGDLLPFQVLAYSIVKRTARTVDIQAINNASVPEISDPRFSPYTEFSFARFLIPSLCGYQGRAVYMDSDMLVLRDFSELWDLPLGQAKILIERGSRQQKDRGKHAAVMLLDCARLSWHIEEILQGLGKQYDYNQLMAISPLLQEGEMQEGIPAGWNDLDSYSSERTRNLHYTEIRTQPWVYADHPYGHLWIDELAAALREGAIARTFVEEQVRLGHARPSLLLELERHDVDKQELLAHDRKMQFVAHRELLRRFAERKRNIRRQEYELAIANRPWLAPLYRALGRLRGN